MAQNQGPKSDFERQLHSHSTALQNSTAIWRKKTSNLELERGAPQIPTRTGYVNTGSGLLCKIFKQIESSDF